MKKPKKPNGFFENQTKPKKPDIDKEIDIEQDKEKELVIDKDIEKEIDSDIEKEKVKKGKTDFDYVSEKLDKVIGKTNESVKKECYSYLKYLSLEVVLYGITITEKARNPCWNYTKKVLEDYKSKKICTFNQLLEYLDKVERNKNNYKNQTHYAFMDDMHSEEEWESLYDN